MEQMPAEDFDKIDERAVEVHEGHPVDVLLSVRLTPEESRMLNELAKREGTDVLEAVRAAIRHYATEPTRRAAS